ncbi:MAG: vanadium-dependent haloperoxidase [Lewinellaceae bacterium]|nr:vanadium-dependent haloperoxidase [Lewinellaceae bacterium]
MKKIATLLLLCLGAIPFGCDKADDDPSARALTYKTTRYDGQLAHEWIKLADQMIRANNLHGPQAARVFGYLGLTTWESVCRGIENGRSMSGQINDYTAPAFDEDKAYDWGIVLCTAMRTVFPHLVEGISNTQRSEVDVLAAVQEDLMLQKGLSEQVRQDSKDLGARIGARIVDRIRKDGRDVIRNIVPVFPLRDAEHPWYWDPATLGQAPVEPLWGTVRTFVLDNAQTCEPPPPLPWSVDPGGDFYAEAKTVYDIERTPTNKAIAYHWENGTGRTSTSAGHWMRIARHLLEREGSNLAECAKTYCLVSFAAADGYSSAWFLKYKYFLLRPVTYIREQIDPTWTPLLHTPPSPDYTSEAAVLGGACPTMLIRAFGDIGFVDPTHLGSPLFTPDGGPFVLPERTFGSLTQAGNDAVLGQILGGVHFPRACVEGQKTGQCVANTILSRLNFGF